MDADPEAVLSCESRCRCGRVEPTRSTDGCGLERTTTRLCPVVLLLRVYISLRQCMEARAINFDRSAAWHGEHGCTLTIMPGPSAIVCATRVLKLDGPLSCKRCNGQYTCEHNGPRGREGSPLPHLQPVGLRPLPCRA
jgi:hypothetical protein